MSMSGGALAHRLVRLARLRRNLGHRRRHPFRVSKLPAWRHGADIDAWLELTARQWRLRVATAPIIGPTVTLVCVTNRPHELAKVVENVRRQRYRNTRLVVVPDCRAFDERALAVLYTLDNVDVLKGYEDAPLGTCLNAAIEFAGTRYIAKIDDDDYYGPDYVSHMLYSLQASDAGVVGKHSCYGYLRQSNQTVLRFPGHEWEYTTNLAGGTLLFDLARIGDVRFPDVCLGEDVGFLEALERRGELLFATDRFNYLQHRTGTNTWRLTDESYLADSVLIGIGERRDTVTGLPDAAWHGPPVTVDRALNALS